MLVTALPSNGQRLSKACQDVAKVLTQPSKQDVTHLSPLRSFIKGVIQRLPFGGYIAATYTSVTRMVLKRCGFQE